MLVPPHPVSPEVSRLPTRHFGILECFACNCQCAEAAELLLDVEPDEEHKELDVHVAAAISQLWADPGIKATFSRSHEYQVLRLPFSGESCSFLVFSWIHLPRTFFPWFKKYRSRLLSPPIRCAFFLVLSVLLFSRVVGCTSSACCHDWDCRNEFCH